MTRDTDRHNIQPKLFVVAFMMMILFCAFSARALQGISTRQLARFNGPLYSIFSFYAFRASNIITLFGFFVCFFTFPALVVTFLGIFVFLCLPMAFVGSFTLCGMSILSLIVRMASLAFNLISIFRSTVFIKFKGGFDLFTNITSFCYNWFSHNVLSLQKNVLVRAGCWHIPAVGSLYYTNSEKYVK